jgi:hypothetical protein
MCSLDGRNGTITGAIPGKGSKRAWREHLYFSGRWTRALEDRPGYPVVEKEMVEVMRGGDRG